MQDMVNKIYMTPFIEAILFMVKETCEPSLPNWELELCRKLMLRYYHETIPRPGRQVDSEGPTAFHARLLDFEIRHSPSQPDIKPPTHHIDNS